MPIGIHVFPRGKKWVVRKAGAARALRIFITQLDAILYAEAVRKGAKLYVHNIKGIEYERV